MWWLGLSAVAVALPPDGTPGLFSVGNGVIDRVAISEDGSVVVGRDNASDQGFLLFVEDWSIHALGSCGALTGAAVVPLSDGTWDVWTSCNDGRLTLQHFDGKSVNSVTDADGVEVAIELSTALAGVWYHSASQAVYALGLGNDDTPTLHVVDPVTLLTDSSVFGGYPLEIQPWKNFNEGVISGDRLIIHHAGYNMTAINLGANPSYIPSNAPTLAITVEDIAPSWNGGVYAVDTSGFIAEYLPISATFQIMLSDLGGPETVVASLDPDDPWLVVTGRQIKVWELSGSGAVVGDNDTYFWASAENLDNPIQDALVQEGYLFGGGEGGNLHVSTARPWVYPKQISVSPTAATEGDRVQLTFIVDEPGRWEVRRGGSRRGDGLLLLDGDVEEDGVDQEISVELTVTEDWHEGDNILYVIHENGRLLQGHARTSLFVDNPPDPPVLRKKNLLFSDGALLLEFDGIPDGDLDHYAVYVSTTPFEPGAWKTGGPPYDGDAALKTPISVTKAGGEAVRVRLEPLENDVKHYVAVRAWDQGGLEGEMSNVISQTPRPSYTAAGLSGERGGAPCSSTRTMAGWTVIFAAGVSLVRRRRGVVAASVAAIGLTIASPASAQERGQRPDWSDLTPSYGNFELRYGVVNLEDPNINAVYNNNPSNLLQVEMGPQLYRVFEADFGFGFFQELDQMVDASGIESADKTMLTWWPLTLDATARLHIVDEQFLVPHARIGMDYVVWSEKYDDGFGGKDTIRGAKTGFHWAAGAGLLLDVFARRRASLLEAQTGINDSYLVFEWREQHIDDRKFPWSARKSQGLNFSGSVVTVGIKLDY